MGCQRIPQTTTDLEPISSPSSARSARTDSRDGSCRASARSCLRHMRARWDRSLAQPLHLAAQLAVLFLKFEDARDSSQVDAFLLAELLRLREAGDVAQRIASRATFRTLRYDQAKAIVLAQRLRMHVCGCTLASSPAAPTEKTGSSMSKPTSAAPSRSARPATIAMAHISYSRLICRAARAWEAWEVRDERAMAVSAPERARRRSHRMPCRIPSPHAWQRGSDAPERGFPHDRPNRRSRADSPRPCPKCALPRRWTSRRAL